MSMAAAATDTLSSRSERMETVEDHHAAHAAALKTLRRQRLAALVREVDLAARMATFGGLGYAAQS